MVAPLVNRLLNKSGANATNLKEPGNVAPI